MSFIKRGDSTEILDVINSGEELDPEETEKKLKQARQQAKNIDKAGNKTELPKNSQAN